MQTQKPYRKTSTSKKDNNSSIELQFCRESGLEYRPFTDPRRIAHNDAKKASACDSRARVRGVPDGYLGVMNPEERVTPTSNKATSATQDYPDSVSASENDTSAFAHRPQPQVPTIDVGGTQASDQLGPSNSAGIMQIDMDLNTMSTISSLPQLRLQIPDFSVCQEQPYSSTYTFLDSSCHPADGVTPMSAYQCSSAHLVLPDASDNQLRAEYDERVHDSPQLPDLANGQLVNAAFEWMSAYSSPSPSSFGSPGSAYTSDSFESLGSNAISFSSVIEERRGRTAYDFAHERSASHQIMDLCSNGSCPIDIDHQFLTGPEEVTSQAISISGSSSELPGFDEIARNLCLEDEDLTYLSENHDAVMQDMRGPFTQHADPNAFFASCHDTAVMQGVF